MKIDEGDYLAHYGILRRSGRYPWGSGETPYERAGTFQSMVKDLRDKGLDDTEIARGFGMTTSQFRETKTMAGNERKQAEVAMAQRLRDKGLSNVAIGKRMGRGESYVRSLLAPGKLDKEDVLRSTTSMLRNQVEKKGYIDVGTGVELHLNVSRQKLNSAIAVLREEGYELHKVQIDQLGTNNKTTIKVLAPPGTTYRDIASNKDKIRSITERTDDGGRSWTDLKPPQSVSLNRVGIRYAEQGGTKADGVMYLRPGVKDLSLGKTSYAQVRIAVGGTHYLKGMAMYRDDLPDGVDIMFNTNKSNTGNKLDALKPLKTIKEDGKDTGKVDWENPFGAVIKPGGQRGALNIVNEEGDWEKWSKSLSSQMLSKQSPKLIKSQLDMTYENGRNELDAIKNLSNPAVRKKLLESYSDSMDASAVHLKAAALPKQRSHVILPIDTMKETEIYAPNYNNGDRVVLIRYPHGGKFEIPELTVNNKQPQAKKLLGNATDAVGISHKVAERLSGADFDGDTVLVIPNNHGKVKNASPLQGLKDFDPQRAYPGYPGMIKMDETTKGFQMGDVSNLITDMTIQGASETELARAVRHSMVVIDAEKHGLNWKQSAIDNGIAQLKEKYQGKSNAGASTLISRATSRTDVRERKYWTPGKKGAIDPSTGKKVFEETGAHYIQTTVNKKTGKVTEKVVYRTQKSQKLAETDDAHTLSSGTLVEKIYADHSNKLKELANEARREYLRTETTPYSPAAKAAYSKEVASLNAKLRLALENAPRERQAQVIANAMVAQKRAANPDLTKDEVKKLKSIELKNARARTGAGKTAIRIEDAEWDAIQAGAISNSKLSKILDHADLDRVKELATPKSQLLMTTAKKQRALTMLAAGYTQAEVAQALGVSVSTLKNNISGE